ncbi:MAG: His/Gly/Thr/Pro-type tRNA ligase C-terminal domain-containing protein [Cycloclasticus sp.]|nr:His/Gly/Thr/Pro-type tRNA ligase C-terminal domain-containing protein [Cycloclasticus sp.]
MPHRIVLGDKGLDSGTVEYKGRTDTDSKDIPLADIIDYLTV